MIPPAEAVRVAVWAVVTAETVAVNPALLEPAGTVTEAGTATALSLLDRLTASPPVPAAAVRLTVQMSLPGPVIDAWVQVSLLSTPGAASPVPLRLMIAVLGEALSLIVMLPLAAPTTVGSKTTESAAVCPGFNVSGKLTPDMLKPDPVRDAALMVSGAVPEDVSVTDCAVEMVFTVTLPKFRLAVLNCNPGTYATRLIVKLWMLLPSEAVRVAVCAVVTAEIMAVNEALVAPAGTVTEAGTLTALLLLPRLTDTPPFGTAAVSITVQVSDPAPVKELRLQEMELNDVLLRQRESNVS